MLSRNFILTAVITLLLSISFISCNNSGSNSSANASLETQIDSASYSLGYINGSSLKEQGMGDINLDALQAGLKDAFDDQDPEIDQGKMRMIVQFYQMQKQQEAQQARQDEAEENKKAGEAFLAENKDKEGVKVTESGLQYKILEEGTGESPSPADTVVVHYTGTHLDGTEFDSSRDGDPAEFQLNRVITGWTEGVQLMKEGARYKFWIPGDLAYGMNPRPGGPIGPNETLVFEVELIEVK